MNKPEQPDWSGKKGWMRGDDAAAEAERLRKIDESKKGLPATIAGSSVERTGVSENLPRVDQPAIFESPERAASRFRFAVLKEGGKFTHRFKIDSGGHIEESDENPDAPDLLSCLGVGDINSIGDVLEVVSYKFKPEELERAAENVKKVFPNQGKVTFEFRESPSESLEKWIEYTATVHMDIIKDSRRISGHYKVE